MPKGPPSLGSGILNNGPLNAGYEASFDYHINADGTVATKSRPVAGSFVSSAGWLRSPAGEIVVSAVKDAGAQITKCGVLTNPDGSAVVTTTQTNPFLNSLAMLVNGDGSMIVANGGT